MAPIEVTSAEAAVAQQEQAIIAADARLQNAKDALIRALYPGPTRPASLETTDAPTLGHIAIDEPAGEKMALDRRVELKAAKLDLESKGVLAKAAENRLKPQLDAYVGYTGDSYQYSALSGVNRDLNGFKYPGYVMGLNLSVPLGNHTAKGNLLAAKANARSSELSLRDLELGIQLEVRQASRNVDAAEKGVEAAKKTRTFREKDLEAEQKKFENGMSTNFLVLSKQNDLDSAKSAELQAQITYAKAVTALERPWATSWRLGASATRSEEEGQQLLHRIGLEERPPPSQGASLKSGVDREVVDRITCRVRCSCQSSANQACISPAESAPSAMSRSTGLSRRAASASARSCASRTRYPCSAARRRFRKNPLGSRTRSSRHGRGCGLGASPIAGALRGRSGADSTGASSAGRAPPRVPRSPVPGPSGTGTRGWPRRGPDGAARIPPGPPVPPWPPGPGTSRVPPGLPPAP